jgi:hypothetical protein
VDIGLWSRLRYQLQKWHILHELWDDGDGSVVKKRPNIQTHLKIVCDQSPSGKIEFPSLTFSSDTISEESSVTARFSFLVESLKCDSLRERDCICRVYTKDHATLFVGRSTDAIATFCPHELARVRWPFPMILAMMIHQHSNLSSIGCIRAGSDPMVIRSYTLTVNLNDDGFCAHSERKVVPNYRTGADLLLWVMFMLFWWKYISRSRFSRLWTFPWLSKFPQYRASLFVKPRIRPFDFSSRWHLILCPLVLEWMHVTRTRRLNLNHFNEFSILYVASSLSAAWTDWARDCQILLRLGDSDHIVLFWNCGELRCIIPREAVTFHRNWKLICQILHRLAISIEVGWTNLPSFVNVHENTREIVTARELLWWHRNQLRKAIWWIFSI